MQTVKKTILSHPRLSVFLLALLVRLAALGFRLPELGTPLIKDSFLYQLMAEGLRAGAGLLNEGHPTAVVQPLYPLFLAAVYTLCDGSVVAVLLIQIVLSALTAVLLAVMTRCLAGERAGLAAGVILALYWPLALVASRILTETLFVFFLVAACYSLVLHLRTRKISWAALAGLLLGLSCLTRAVTLYLAPLVVLWLTVLAWRERDSRRLWSALLFCAAFGTALAPWTARNWRVFHAFLPGGTNSGMVLYIGNFPPGGHGFGMNLRSQDLPPEDRYVFDLPELEFDRAMRRIAIQRLRQDPAGSVCIALRKALFFWVPVDWEILGHGEGIVNPWYVWLILLTLPWLFSPRGWKDYLVPLGVTLYFFLISLATYGSPRLRLPVEPMLMPLAAAGWLRLEQTLSRHLLWLGLPVLMLLSSVAALVWGGAIKEFLAGILSAVGLW
ncbi:glycosyltransferase family 39 protein [bacterium]|nr:glycosyltransferase family 39 protein [bacterium]